MIAIVRFFPINAAKLVKISHMTKPLENFSTKMKQKCTLIPFFFCNFATKFTKLLCLGIRKLKVKS